MASVDLGGWGLQYPLIGTGNNTNTLSSLVMDAAGEQIAFVIRAPKDGTINAVTFMCATVAQSPTNGLKVSLQDLDASGDPDGTADQFRVVATGDVATNTVVTTGLLTSDGTDTGTKRTVSKGDLIAVVVEFETFVVGDDVDIYVTNVGVWAPQWRPSQYVDHFTTSWTKFTNGTNMFIGVQYSDETWEPIYGCLPLGGTTAGLNVTTSSSPDEVGMKFTPPFPMTVDGFIGTFNVTATTADFQLKLYDSADTVLATATATGESAAVAVGAGTKFYPFDAVADTVALSADSTYRVTLLGTSASNVGIYFITPPSISYNTAMPWGSTAVATERTDAGAWTDDSTDGTQYTIGLRVTALDDGASSGNTLIMRARRR